MIRCLTLALIVLLNTQQSASSQQQDGVAFGRFAALKCDVTVGVCATCRPSKSVQVRWKSQCVGECQHRRQQSACVGVNYRQDTNTCDLFDTDPTNYTANVPGCQYIKVMR